MLDVILFVVGIVLITLIGIASNMAHSRALRKHDEAIREMYRRHGGA